MVLSWLCIDVTGECTVLWTFVYIDRTTNIYFVSHTIRLPMCTSPYIIAPLQIWRDISSHATSMT